MSRTGNWIATFSGVKWFVTDPHPDDVHIDDIAHALSLVCRYGGHVREFYSVAQHSVIVALALLKAYPADLRLALCGLLHDAAEAYLGEMVRPLKLELPSYKALEIRTEAVIAEGLELPAMSEEQRRHIKHFDDVALMTERRDLVNHCGHEWTPRAEPLPKKIEPWSSAFAERAFMEAYRGILGRIAAATIGARL
jgi:5'-deoxynucleotidase YfbR-like HD superfamily hydrolase